MHVNVNIPDTQSVYPPSTVVEGTYCGEQVHCAVQDHQFGTRLHTVHRTVQEWRSVLHLHVAGHMVHLLTDLKEQTLSSETWSRQIYYCYSNYCVTFKKLLGVCPVIISPTWDMLEISRKTRCTFCKKYCYENVIDNSVVVREYSDPITLFTFYDVAGLWYPYLKSFQ